MKTIRVAAAVIRRDNEILATARGYVNLKADGSSQEERSRKVKLHSKP